MKKTQLLAPAKINLFLEVLGRRPDGYHNISTLFAKVRVFDKLTITALKSETTINLEIKNNCGCSLPPLRENIVVGAAEKFRRQFDFDCGLNITLEKNIPVGAGLGGGSSDAASTLIGLCKLSGKSANPVINKTLVRIATELGADVAFFLYKGTFSTAKGVGEILSPLSVGKIPLRIIIAYPGFPVATKDAYGGLEIPSRNQILTKLASLHKLKRDLKAGLPLTKWKSHLFNRLETSVLTSNEKLGRLRTQMNKLSGEAALMSGAGSSVFALTDDEEKAKDIAKKVQKKAKIVFDTCFLGEEI